MEIKKAGQSYDKYVLTVSYGELSSLVNALRGSGTGALDDEMLHAMEWYSERLPEPGSEDTGLIELDSNDKSDTDGVASDDEGRKPAGNIDSYLDDPENFHNPENGDQVDIDTSLVSDENKKG
jgi:hypothetical protein